MVELLFFIAKLINLYVIIVIASVVLSWLINFGVINGSSPMVRSIEDGLRMVTEPALRPIRNALPNTGGLDFSPVVLILACMFVMQVIIPNLARMFA